MNMFLIVFEHKTWYDIVLFTSDIQIKFFFFLITFERREYILFSMFIYFCFFQCLHCWCKLQTGWIASIWIACLKFKTHTFNANNGRVNMTMSMINKRVPRLTSSARRAIMDLRKSNISFMTISQLIGYRIENIDEYFSKVPFYTITCAEVLVYGR